MIARLAVDSLIMWSAQVVLLVAAAALGCRWLPHARARLWIWQAVLGVSLLLPFIMPTRLPEQILVTQGVDDGTVNVSTHVIVKVPAREQFWRGEGVLWLVAGVAIARLLWLAFGILRLRRLRSGAQRLLHPPIPFDHAADWYVSDAVHGPVTFGWKRPSILLPRRVVEMPRELLESVAAHELVHVFRRDWIVVLAEELLRSLSWFHPAVWFALGEIQIAREEVVDAEAVNLISDRERYLDALLAVAEQRMVQDLAPAPLFLKKHQLARRVATLVKETSMSKLNLGARVALVVTATLAGLGSAAWFFPFPSAAQAIADDPGISVAAGGQLIHRPALHLAKTSGVVVLDASLDAKGEVVDAHVVSGPDALRRDALANVLQWHYQSPGSPTSVQISIQYGLQAIVAQPSIPPPPLPPPPPIGASQTFPVVKDIVFVGVDPAVQDQIRNALPIHPGDTINPQAYVAAVNALQRIDEHLMLAPINIRKADGSTSQANLQIRVRPDTNPSLPPPPPAVSTDGKPLPLRVGGNVQSANLVTKVTPVYPAEAKQAHIQGTVRFNATIGTDGKMKDLTAVEGDPLLAEAAMKAVWQWVYRPTLLNGQPVEVQTQIDVNFTLAE